MNAPEKLFLPDIQASPDGREMAIDRVGVKSIRHPVAVERPDGTVQQTVAVIDMYVGLPHHVKGTHMSRFLEVLAEEHGSMSVAGFRNLMAKMLVRLDAESGYIEMRFPYFIAKRAPVSGVESLLDYQLTLSIERTGGVTRTRQKVVVPVTSLCPCSKKVADYGAHNQRAHLTVTVDLAEPLSIEEQIRVAETAASCEIWALLKRADEKYVTERAYDNPKFVEDVVRDIAVALDADARVRAYVIEAEVAAPVAIEELVGVAEEEAS